MPGRRGIRALLPPQLGGMDGRAAAGGSAKDTGQQARSSAVTRKRTSKPQGGRATYLGAVGTHGDMELLCGREKVRLAVCTCVESSRQGVEAGGHVSHEGRDVGVHRVSGKETQGDHMDEPGTVPAGRSQAHGHVLGGQSPAGQMGAGWEGEQASSC